MELDARKLYLGEGCSSLFTFCTQILRLSEHAAYGRIEAARAARRFPAVLDLLSDGSLALTAVGRALVRAGAAGSYIDHRLAAGSDRRTVCQRCDAGPVVRDSRQCR